MKSIMEEASSISKAIDLAWNRAGKPSQFSIKILEEPERNMFGLTVKSAKIAIFFEEQRKVEKPSWQVERPKPIRPEQPNRTNETQPQRYSRPEWTNELAQEAKMWVHNTLKLIGIPQVQYSSSHSESALKFIFNSSLTGFEGKDRMLFSSFAQLILATLRHRHQKHFRNLKVILVIK